MAREEEILEYCGENHYKPFSIEACVAIKAIEWADEHPRKELWDGEKVCNVLRNKMDSNWFYEKMERADYDSIIKDLHKAMEN